MALLPIAWNIETGTKIIGRANKLKPIFDYPATQNVGTVFGTSFTLKLYLDPKLKTSLEKQGNRWKNSERAVCIEIERFCGLSALSIQGSLSLHEITTHKRIGLKVFQHSFKDGEKSFVFQMSMLPRAVRISTRMFSDLSLHGHICVDASKDDGVLTNVEPSIEELGAFCTLPQIHKSYSLLSNLSDAFRRMLNDNCFSDVTLNCGGEKFCVHKSVLSSRSPVFKAMFESGMKESQSPEITISDVEPAALRVLLNYIYCGKIDDLSDTIACDLLYAADKYDLPVLKENCVSFLETAISLDNICLVLSSAILHDESLKAIAFNFVFENVSTILNSEEWKALVKENPFLSQDILLFLSKRALKSKKRDSDAL